jgi:NADH:ubiquinone oxidoreductase subunit E
VGGGKKLENLVNQVLRDEVASSTGDVAVEICDCLGECGYGPNLVVDGRLVNGVRGRMAVLNALGLAASASTEMAEAQSAPEKKL